MCRWRHTLNRLCQFLHKIQIRVIVIFLLQAYCSGPEGVMVPIITVAEKCRKCYSCVRSCPVKAIKVDKSYTEIIFERCIGCGNCLSNCPQKAKIVTDKVAVTERLLASG